MNVMKGQVLLPVEKLQQLMRSQHGELLDLVKSSTSSGVVHWCGAQVEHIIRPPMLDKAESRT